ncbi:MAG: TonB-dependent receptor, partial [Pseudomonadota bacterium]
DLQGEPVVASIMLQDDISSASRWELSVRKNLSISPLTPFASISRSDLWRGIEYNAGLELRRPAFGDQGTENVLDADGSITERRFDERSGLRHQASGNLTGSVWLDKTLLRFNTEVGLEDLDEEIVSRREPQLSGSGPRTEFFVDEADSQQFELGADVEREINRGFVGKAIFLYNREDEDAVSSQRSIDDSGTQTRFRLADSDSVKTESIVRVELDWARQPNRAVQINLEGAFNVLDNNFSLSEDTGAGPMPVVVPGANARVEEVRWDLLILESWSTGRFVLDYGLGAEQSTISQSGDVNQKRNFFFLKPRSVLTYSPGQAKLTRLRLEREVAQLDFDDFVSATVFQDDDLALGNPNLRPETTWVAELSHERRFGELGVIKLTAFHHWISDAQDLLPLTPLFEAPGNIGDGRVWGTVLETTVPLDFLGLDAAQLEFNARWQDSTVADPVTLEDRVLSAEYESRRPLAFDGENKYAFTIDFRQDFKAQRLAWGWDLRTRAEHPLFKVNELDILDEDVEFNVFVETTRWLGLKIRLHGQNLLNSSQLRDRTVFVGQRGLSSVDFRELEDNTDGRRIIFSLSGSF